MARSRLSAVTPQLAEILQTESFDIILCHNRLDTSTTMATCYAPPRVSCGIRRRYCPSSYAIRRKKQGSPVFWAF
jgi:hypothetical protein